MTPGNVTTQVLPELNPPGWPYVNDSLTTEQRAAWSQLVSSWMQNEITAKNPDGSPLLGGGGVVRTPLTQFFNGTITPYNTSQPPQTISWTGFPGLIAKHDPNSRFLIVEGHRDVMDEYLEWSTNVDDDGYIQYVVFTCEGFEYFSFLGTNAPDVLLDLYKSTNPDFADQIKKEDLFDEHGNYNPYNKWNGVTCKTPGHPEDGLTTVNPGCIMHLAQVNNTLGAEIDIAAQATVLRRTASGHIIDNKTTLCNCSKYGNPERNSDPAIGIGINTFAQRGDFISIADPVAIYMIGFNTANFQLDVDGTGEDLQPIPDGTFTWVRGNIDKKMGLRLRVQIPKGTMGTGDNAGRQLTVSDIFDTSTNKYIKYGGQFADYITMGVSAVVIEAHKAAPAQFCPKAPSGDGTQEAVAMQSLAVNYGPGHKKTPHGLHTVRRP